MDLTQIRRIACIGEVMIELSAAGADTARLGVAGDSFNTAVYLSRALRGTGAEVGYVTALGTDPWSDRIEAAIIGHGLTPVIERRADRGPGLYAIDTDAAGERRFTYWRSASAARTLFSDPCAVPLSALEGFDMIYLSGITLAILPAPVRAALIAWIDRYRAGGGAVAFDSNYRPRLWQDPAHARAAVAALWARADVALPSLDDELALFGDAGEDAVLARLGLRRGAVKRGARGPRDLGGADLPDPPPAPRVVDSTAAGDSFNAAYLAALMRGQGPVAAAQAGHALAARVIGAPGAILPDA